MLYRSTDRPRRGGAPVQYLSYSASSHSREKYAPPNAGTKHVEILGDLMLGAAIGAISGLVGIKAGHVDFKLAMLI
jgi:hypothetical protein